MQVVKLLDRPPSDLRHHLARLGRWPPQRATYRRWLAILASDKASAKPGRGGKRKRRRRASLEHRGRL